MLNIRIKHFSNLQILRKKDIKRFIRDTPIEEFDDHRIGLMREIVFILYYFDIDKQNVGIKLMVQASTIMEQIFLLRMLKILILMTWIFNTFDKSLKKYAFSLFDIRSYNDALF